MIKTHSEPKRARNSICCHCMILKSINLIIKYLPTPVEMLFCWGPHHWECCWWWSWDWSEWRRASCRNYCWVEWRDTLQHHSCSRNHEEKLLLLLLDLNKQGLEIITLSKLSLKVFKQGAAELIKNSYEHL